MLFLYNAHVIDIGDAVKRIQSQDFPLSLPAAHKLTPRDVEAIFKEAAAAFDDVVLEAPAKAAGLAALAAWRMGANAAVTVRPAGARAAVDCLARFADVHLQTIAWLGQQAACGALTPAMIDREVWAKAA